ncbi:molybdate ABC transporter substrate-binding protein [soil metagenome]
MWRQRLAMVVSMVAMLAACSDADPVSGSGGATATATTGEVTVFAAASLTDAFTEIGDAVEAAHPELEVTFNFAGSQQLATQIAQGAPADVFASADQRQVDLVVAAGLADGDPAVFAHNRLEIVVEPGNPRDIATLGDLARDDVTVVVAAEQAPAGRYARTALGRAGVTLSPASLETDVRGVLTKVALGEADAGIVYASDVVAAGDRVDGVAIPDDRNVVATYPISLISGAPNLDAGRLFIAAVRSEAGRATLERHGFGAP